MEDTSFRTHSNTWFIHTKAQLRHGSPEVSDLVLAAFRTGPRSPEDAAQLGSTLWYKPCRWRGAVRSRLSTSPAPAKPHLCRPASQHSENAFGNFYFQLLLNMKSNCVFIALISWPSLGITRTHFVLQDSESISRGGNNEAIERSDEDCPSLPTSPRRSLFWNSHSVRP